MKQLKKTLLTLVALLAVTTGAWADETLLLTIENSGYPSFTSGSMTFDDKVTVTFSNEVYNEGDTYGWYAATESLLTVAGINGYTITSCKFYTNDGIAMTGYTVEGESPSVYLFGGGVYNDANQSEYLGDPGITKIEVYTAAASSASGPEVAWNKAEKTGTFTMPGGNVTLEPEYYPQAELTAAPTAIDNVPATTDGAIVNAGTVANIGETETAQGTVMYYVSQTEMTDDALLALAADQWTADVPTAESLAQGQAYVYYYVRGNDSDTDEENFSDGDIKALTVTIAAAPTYAVTFKAANANTIEAGKATVTVGGTAATVTEGKLESVKLGSEVKLKAADGYKFRKVEVKKGAATPSLSLTNPAVGQVIGSDGNNYDANATLPAGTTAVAVIAYVGSDTYDATFKNGLAIALADEKGDMIWSTAKSTCEGKTAITGAKWCLPSQDQWKQMFKANGGDEESYTGLITTITTAGGATLLEDEVAYWSSSECTPNVSAYFVFLTEGNAQWIEGNEAPDGCLVRACLAF